ncbi:MAG: TIGR01459 family HAD-type hydrolase [Alphaproteobacteria bacterium]|nr:TIGR01459 family HAD-type hydrolase [Alphaproteobacteria bacterium]
MTKTINSLLDIAEQVDAFFIDMFGVLWDGKAFYPEALNICQQLIQKHKKIYVLTNTTMLKEDFEKNYRQFGLLPKVHYTDVVTSGDILKFELEQHALMDKITNSKHSLYYLIGLPADKILHSILKRQTDDISKASVVYLGAPQKVKDGQNITLKSIRSFIPELKKALQYQLPAICANPDYFAMIHQRKYVTQGSLAIWYEKHGGKVYWIGKPYRQIYDFALQMVQVGPRRCAVVGDTIRTDILGGKNAGMNTVLITGHGITHNRMAQGETLEQIAKQEKALPDFLLSILQ